MKQNDKTGQIGNLLFVWRLLVCATVVVLFVTGRAEPFLTAWIGESGHFWSIIKIGLLAIPLWIPNLFSTWIMKIRLASWYQMNEEDSEKSTPVDSLTSSQVFSDLLSSLFAVGVGIWFIYLFVEVIGNYWWVGESVLFLVSLWSITFRYPEVMAREAKSIDSFELPKLEKAVQKILDKTSIFLDRAHIWDRNKILVLVGIIPSQRCLVMNKFVLDLFSEEELEAVLLHECGHIRYQWVDRLQKAIWGIRIVAGYALAAWMLQSFFSIELSRGNIYVWGLFLMCFLELINTFSRVIQMIVARWEENLADDFAVEHLGAGSSLASALQKLHDYIPVEMKKRALSYKVLSTHPEIRRRIRRHRRKQDG